MILTRRGKMQKTDFIKEQFIKNELEKEEPLENEFYAEMYASDLIQQFIDNDDLQQSKRLKCYNAEKSDLNDELNELKMIKSFIVDNTNYNREKQGEILKSINEKIAEINNRMEIVEQEVDYITTRINAEVV